MVSLRRTHNRYRNHRYPCCRSFPSLTSYLKRSRDAARAAHLKDISTAVGAYYSDHEGYPNSASGCIDNYYLSTNYMEAGVPQDPTTGFESGCGVARFYTYGSGTSSTSSPQFALGGSFENSNGGNTASGVSTISGSFSAAERSGFDL